MFSEIGSDLKKVALVGVGAVALMAEMAGDFAGECIKKGEATVEQGKAVSDDLQQKMQIAAQERREQRLNTEIEGMTHAERDALRLKLDTLDKEEVEAAEMAKAAEAADENDENDKNDEN